MDTTGCVVLDREVSGASDSVELVEVVGQHAAVEERLAQLLQRVHAVVDPREQHRLVEQQAAGGAQLPTGPSHGSIDFARMVGVHDDDAPQGDLLKPGAELLIDPLWEHDRHARMDAQAAKLGQRAESSGELGEPVGGEGEWIPSAQDELPQPGFGLQFQQRRAEALGRRSFLAVGEMAPEAIAAMDRAGAGGDEQRASFVLEEHAGTAACGPVPDRVLDIALDLAKLEVEGKDLSQQRIVWIAAAHLGGVAPRHAHREAMRGRCRYAFGEFGKIEEVEEGLGIGEGIPPGALPAPESCALSEGLRTRVMIEHLARALTAGCGRFAILAPASESLSLRSERAVMASYGLNDVRNGLKILIDGEPYTILECDFIKPGKGQAFTRIKIRNLRNGRVTERTLKATDTVEGADVVDTDMQYLYFDGEYYHFMHPETYEQYQADRTAMGDAAQWLKGEEMCIVTLWNGQPLTVTPPNFVELAIVETDPGVRGDTASGGGKPAKLETGAVVRVPLFVNQGEVIRIDTRTGEYVARVK